MTLGLFEDRFLSFVKEQGIFGPEDRLLLAISGGRDSVVLFHLLKKAGVFFDAAHVNFGLRGVESDEEERFVVSLCERHGVRLQVLHPDTENYRRSHRQGIQEAARNIRYDWFSKLVAEKGMKGVLLGHHASDQTETILFNLIRGGGTRALAGMRPVNGMKLRPLLFATREEITDYALAEGLEWREDSSNSKNDYSRNYIRNEVCTLLKKYEPDLDRIVFRQSLLRQKEIAFLEQMLDTIGDRLVKKGEREWEIAAGEVRGHEHAFLILHHLLSPLGFSVDTIGKLSAEKAPATGSLFYGKRHTLLVDRDRFILRETDMETGAEQVLIPGPGIYPFGDLEIEVSLGNFPGAEEAGRLAPNTLFVRIPDGNLPLLLRNPAAGDRIQPLGMKGSKLLSDVFTDKKMDRFRKGTMPVLVWGEIVAALPGLMIADGFRCQKDGQPCWKIIIR